MVYRRSKLKYAVLSSLEDVPHYFLFSIIAADETKKNYIMFERLYSSLKSFKGMIPISNLIFSSFCYRQEMIS